MYEKIIITLIFGAVFLSSCGTENQHQIDNAKAAFSANDISSAPDWAKEVIWYQIFVERFRNGDPSNDPTPADIAGAYPGFVPEAWAATPWTQDWYQPDNYFEELEGRQDLSGNTIKAFDQKLQLRRYGGDLQGVMDKLDYIDSLGVTAIYFNPLNDAPSLHKYDARNWRHIDRNFGPSPQRDAMIMAEEIPDDPATWQMTGADSLFLTLLKTFHDRGIRVILDYSWNHTGAKFWALEDIREKGKASKYADWYWIEKYDDPNTPENEFAYKGWFNVKDLPEIKETVTHEASSIQAYEGNLYSEAVKKHIFNVTKRWLDPNGDGDPSDGVDGFRLDVAAELPLGFWREYREVVRAANPDAYLVGEIWWEEWPDKLLDPAPFLKGDVFDAVMNYRWYRAARHFFAQAPDEMPVSEFVDSVQSFMSNLREQNNYAMMNLTASHDAPRVATSLYNKNRYKYNSKPNDENGYKINRPDEGTYQTLRLLLAQQFTYIGAPHIWAGDEMGMWGEDDPANRKPLIWPDYQFEPETGHPLGWKRPEDDVRFDRALFNYYRHLIEIRNQNPVLAHGGIDYVVVNDENGLLAYSRYNENDEALVVFNLKNETQNLQLPVKTGLTYSDVLGDIRVFREHKNSVKLRVPGRRAAILVGKRAILFED